MLHTHDCRILHWGFNRRLDFWLADYHCDCRSKYKRNVFCFNIYEHEHNRQGLIENLVMASGMNPGAVAIFNQGEP